MFLLFLLMILTRLIVFIEVTKHACSNLSKTSLKCFNRVPLTEDDFQIDRFLYTDFDSKFKYFDKGGKQLDPCL